MNKRTFRVLKWEANFTSSDQLHLQTEKVQIIYDCVLDFSPVKALHLTTDSYRRKRWAMNGFESATELTIIVVIKVRMTYAK